MFVRAIKRNPMLFLMTLGALSCVLVMGPFFFFSHAAPPATSPMTSSVLTNGQLSGGAGVNEDGLMYPPPFQPGQWPIPVPPAAWGGVPGQAPVAAPFSPQGVNQGHAAATPPAVASPIGAGGQGLPAAGVGLSAVATQPVLKTNKAEKPPAGLGTSPECSCATNSVNYRQNMDWPGGDFADLPVATKEECCAACELDERCFHWTLATRDMMCYLKGPGLALMPSTKPEVLWSGAVCRQTKPPTPPPPPPNREHATESIKNAFLHAWNGYANTCFGQDELNPVSHSCGNWLGAGLTIIDALSTLQVMGLQDEFAKARAWVSTDLRFNLNRKVSFFETVIRILGGLLSAYDFTEDKMFLDKAKELADTLNPVFGSAKGIPFGAINLGSGAVSNSQWTGGSSVLAEIGTIQMEYFDLSHHLGDPSYHDKAKNIVDVLDQQHGDIKGLYPLFIDTQQGTFKNRKISFGGCGDSFYEYLVKVWILTGKTDKKLQRMYIESMEAMINNMIKTNSAGFTYLPNLEGGNSKSEMEHLTCFTPGMLALGAKSGIVDAEMGARHLEVAKKLVKSCYEMYRSTATGIGPESARFQPAVAARDPAYHLRPETLESIFYMYRITGDSMYQTWGWNIFLALEKHCKTPFGYAGIKDVRLTSANNWVDKQESFFLAETLKYLYLLFAPPDTLSLAGIDEPQEGVAQFVFNTEAHPIRAWPAETTA